MGGARAASAPPSEAASAANEGARQEAIEGVAGAGKQAARNRKKREKAAAKKQAARGQPAADDGADGAGDDQSPSASPSQHPQAAAAEAEALPVQDGVQDVSDPPTDGLASCSVRDGS